MFIFEKKCSQKSSQLFKNKVYRAQMKNSPVLGSGGVIMFRIKLSDSYMIADLRIQIVICQNQTSLSFLSKHCQNRKDAFSFHSLLSYSKILSPHNRKRNILFKYTIQKTRSIKTFTLRKFIYQTSIHDTFTVYYYPVVNAEYFMMF